MPTRTPQPRHAAPRRGGSARAALVPTVLLVAAGGAFGGLAVMPSGDVPADKAFSIAAASAADPQPLDLDALNAERAADLAAAESRASRDRVRAAMDAAAQAQAAAAQKAAEEAAAAARMAEEEAAAASRYARPAEGRLTSAFGPRWGRLHAGLDIAAGTGSPIRAAAAGTVVSAGSEGAYGRAVRIRHADGTQTLYAHNSALLVSRGEKVAAGQQIAREGSTGRVTGPHLHFEVRVGGKALDPRRWLRDRGVSI